MDCLRKRAFNRLRQLKNKAQTKMEKSQLFKFYRRDKAKVLFQEKLGRSIKIMLLVLLLWRADCNPNIQKLQLSNFRSNKQGSLE